MPAYVIYQGEVTDPVQYEQYKTRAAASIEAAGGRYIVRGGDFDVLEGEAPAGRIVIVEFPSRNAALDWYHGTAYTQARALRGNAAKARLYVVDGLS